MKELEVSPSQLQDYMTVAELGPIQSDPLQGWINPAVKWPQVSKEKGKNAAFAVGCFAATIFSSWLMCFFAARWIYRGLVQVFDETTRQEKQLQKISEDLIYQCLGPLAGSFFGDTPGSFVRTSDAPLKQSWSWALRAGSASCDVQVQQAVGKGLTQDPTPGGGLFKSGALETAVTVDLVRPDGRPIVIPSRWSDRLEVDSENKVRATFKQDLKTRLKSLGAAATAPGDPLGELPLLLRDLFEENSLSTGHRSTLGEGIFMDRGGFDIDNELQQALLLPLRGEKMRRPSRRQAWVSQRRWWRETFLHNYLLATIGGAALSFCYILMAIIAVKLGNMSSLIVLFMPLAIAFSFYVMAKINFPSLAKRRLRVADVATKLKVERDRLGMDDTSIELTLPFQVNLSRTPSSSGSEHLNVELTQKLAEGGAARIAFRVALAQSEGVTDLPELQTRAPTVDPRAFISDVWPLIRRHAAAQGIELPWRPQMGAPSKVQRKEARAEALEFTR